MGAREWGSSSWRRLAPRKEDDSITMLDVSRERNKFKLIFNNTFLQQNKLNLNY